MNTYITADSSAKPMLIGGQWVEGAASLDIVNPANGELAYRVSAASGGDDAYLDARGLGVDGVL